MERTQYIHPDFPQLPNSIIPTKVVFDPGLTWREKALFGIINYWTLQNQHKPYVIATNRYLAKLINTRKDTLSTMLSKLQKKKYIFLEYETQPDEKQVRKIYTRRTGG